MNEKEIFFHVGLGKVASTFLQHNFFPYLKGIYYLPTNKYRYSKRLIPGIESSRILVSREFDVQLEKQLQWFTSTFPTPQVIILLRRHDDWIASQYRRFVKNGYFSSFEKFIDFEKDSGFWKQKDLYYYPMLVLIEKYTKKRPIVLFYDDLMHDPENFLRTMASHVGASFKNEEISYARVHTSFSDKQLKVLRAFTSRFIRKMPPRYHSRLKNWLIFRPVWGFYHLILYAAAWLPCPWVGKDPLIHPISLEQVRRYYEEDWEKVHRYQKQQL